MHYQGRHEHIGSGMIRYVHRWLPDDCDPWSSLAIIHGLGDHGGRFDRMARWFVRHGMMVYAVDLVGHGRSFGRRGCISSYDDLINEVGVISKMTLSRWADIPRFVFGQSMGGNLVLNWALRQTNNITGLIASSPMLRTTQPLSDRYMKVGRQLSRWLPHWRIRVPVDPAKLSRDPRSQLDYLEDGLVHQQVSLRLGMGLVENGEWAIEHAWRLPVPTLLIHGLEDSLTSPHASQEFALNARGTCETRFWTGLRHDLHHEPEWTLVLDDVRRWLASRVASIDRRIAA